MIIKKKRNFVFSAMAEGGSSLPGHPLACDVTSTLLCLSSLVAAVILHHSSPFLHLKYGLKSTMWLMWAGETPSPEPCHLFSPVSLENKHLFGIIFLLKVKAVILESSVAGMVWAGTMYESGENNRKELVVFVSSVFLKCFMLPMLSEVIIKSKLSPLTLAVQVHKGTSADGVMPAQLLYVVF